MDYLFEPKQPFNLCRFFKQHGTGVCATLLVHLLVLIFLLSSQLYSAINGRTEILIDFSEQEQRTAQRLQEEKELLVKEIAARQLDAQLHAQPVRNAAVDASERARQPLRDDRRTDVSRLHAEAQEVQRKLDAARQQLKAQQGTDEVTTPAAATPQQETYQGPSVLTYDLGGRKARSLPIPAYRCRGGGDVTVIIDVNPQGYVVAAAVQTASSSHDECLHEAALLFARKSRFAVQPDTPAKQRGHIVYRFIAQGR